ncbi:pfs domain-containing protein [Colletotrichum tabaci]|uniref:Pfs domain-containing protein n=1 Tax=Colletotrichum tabaci TaxID=1209068 RepID=A0AAV9T1D7_9PEZI
MEVVGAVASFIAIGQALIAGRHAINVLRAIPGIGNELTWLHNEIETLRLVVEEADMRGTSTDESLPETPLLKSARLQLSEIVADLEGIRKGCVRAVQENGKVKAKKTKWFLQQKQLSECRDKARDARANLLAALQTLQLKEVKETKQVVLRIESFAIQTRGIMALQPSSSEVLQMSSCHLPIQHICDKDDAPNPQHARPITQLTTAVEQLVLSDNRPQTASKGVIYPGDIGTDGKTAITHVVAYGTTDAVAFLAELWANQLQSDSFDRTWFFDAHVVMEDNPELPSEEKDALRRMISCNSGSIDAIQTPLHSAAAQTDLAEIQQAVKSHPWAMHQLNHRGETPLHVAVRSGNLDGVRELLRLGCGVNQRDGFGYTPLMEAVRLSHVAMVQWLLDAGCAVDDKNNLSLTALHLAAELCNESSTQILRSLLSAGASATVTGPDASGFLHRVAYHSGCGELDYLDSLSLSGINLDSVDEDGNTVWDCFVYSKGAEDWCRGDIRRPSSDEQEAFTRLYKDIRDRNLDQDIKRLEWTRQYLVDEDQRGATSALDPLIKQKTEWERLGQVETYKTIGLQVREGMWHAALQSVDENIGVLREEMAKSPLENSSGWDYLLKADTEDGETEDEDNISVASTGCADEDETRYSSSDEESGEEEDDV